jgi:hypothetical protein
MTATGGENTYLPPEAAGSAPGRGRLAGRRVLVVGAGTRPSPEPDPPIGNRRAIAVLAAREGATGAPSYDSSKAALLGICRQVAREGMANYIRANLVVPSLVDTPLGRDASRRNPARTARRLPFGRQATAWEVAYATVWLLSAEASYINAHPLVLDGGATSFA